MILGEVHSSSIICISLSKLCFFCQTRYCAAHPSYILKKWVESVFAPIQELKDNDNNVEFKWWCAGENTLLLASGVNVLLQLLLLELLSSAFLAYRSRKSVNGLNRETTYNFWSLVQSKTLHWWANSVAAAELWQRFYSEGNPVNIRCMCVRVSTCFDAQKPVKEPKCARGFVRVRANLRLKGCAVIWTKRTHVYTHTHNKGSIH